MKDYYSEALKAGQKQYKESMARSESPYLPVLDEILPIEKQIGGIDLGLVDIPVEFIVGTKTPGRTNSFAANFMPIADPLSEFASKWKNLCESHLNEGINQPIKAYEYKNRFYIEEGNKRVSVLKYFGAVSIPGEVMRILPERDGSDETELYYEFVDFYRITKINYIEFTKRGSYQKFLQILGREHAQDWNRDIVKSIRTDYYYFRKAFGEQGGDSLHITAADAMLTCASIYGYDAIHSGSESSIRQFLAKTWKEIALVQEGEPIDIVEDPDTPVSGIISKIKPIIPIITKSRSRVKALFLYSNTPENSNWVLSHEKGRLEAEKNLDGKLETISMVCKNEQETEAVMRGALSGGVSVVFATAAEMLNSCLKVAIDFPDADILNCSLNVSHKYIRTYYPRMYEAKFISGAIAGAMCSNDRIGYICNYPVYGNIAEINAFARGVQMTNVNARVYLEWSDDSSLQEKAEELTAKGVRLISVRDMSQTGDKVRVLYGLRQMTDDGTVRELVQPVWNWGTYYEKIINAVLDGSFHQQEEHTPKSLNYFWGMSSDVVGVRFSEELPRGIRYLGELISKAIRMGVCRPFYDPKLDQNGNMEWHNVKATISMDEIINMDWLESNVVGAIPKYEQLNDRAKLLVDVIGVKPARKDPDHLL